MVTATEATPLVSSRGIAPGFIRCVCALWLSIYVYGFSLGLINATLPGMKQEFDISQSEMAIFGGGPVLFVALASRAAGPLADWIGRRALAILTCMLFVVGSVLWAVAPSFEVALVARAVHGFALGLGFVVSSLYTAEVAPLESRGALGTSTEVVLNLGILTPWGLVTFLAEDSWRGLLWAMAALAFAAASAIWLLAVESPRWLAMCGNFDEAKEVLVGLVGDEKEAGIVMAELERQHGEKRALGGEAAVAERTPVCSIWDGLNGGPLWKPLLISQGMGFFHHMTGISFTSFYSTVLLMRDHPREDAQFATFIMGICKFVAVLASTALVDRAGRKPLLLWSSLGMGVAYVAWALQLELARGSLTLAIVALSLVNIGFSLGLGPVNYVVPAEVWSVEHRAEGVAASALTCRLTEAVVALCSLPLLEALGGRLSVISTFFAAVCAASLFFFWRNFDETAKQLLEKVYADRPITEVPC